MLVHIILVDNCLYSAQDQAGKASKDINGRNLHFATVLSKTPS